MPRARAGAGQNDYSSEPQGTHYKELADSTRGEASYENPDTPRPQRPQASVKNEKPDRIRLQSFNDYTSFGSARPWYKRPVVLIAIAVIILLIIAAIIVTIVVVTRKHKDDNTNTAAATTAISAKPPTTGKLL